MRSTLLAIVAAWVAASSAWALTSDEENSVAIYRRLNAGVVNITNRAVAYDFFFNPIPSDSSGSGFILDTQGHVLTNHHVVQGAQRLEVSLADGTKWIAKLVGTDPQTDLAVLQIKAPSEALTLLPLGDSSSLQVGQKVLAIGNPFGLEHSLSAGIISSLRKIVKTGAREIEDVIQTDAAINPGNSGGPLLDSEGRVVGINTAIFSTSGGNMGIGFAIPINTAKRVVADILARGYVVYAYLGTETQTLTPALARALELPAEQGAIVVRVARGSPARKASGSRGEAHRAASVRGDGLRDKACCCAVQRRLGLHGRGGRGPGCGIRALSAQRQLRAAARRRIDVRPRDCGGARRHPSSGGGCQSAGNRRLGADRCHAGSQGPPGRGHRLRHSADLCAGPQYPLPCAGVRVGGSAGGRGDLFRRQCAGLQRLPGLPSGIHPGLRRAGHARDEGGRGRRNDSRGGSLAPDDQGGYHP